MNSKCALVSKLIPFSCVDGPGSRLALFLQGCNMRCKNCHNPWTIGRCNHCGQCASVCPHQALTFTGEQIIWHASGCQQCDTCLHMCPQQATPMAQSMSVAAVLAEVRNTAPFIEGITVSGGEATLQLPFLYTLFAALRADPQLHHLNCLVDSNGLLSETGWHRLLPVFDGAMIDLKAWTCEQHRSLTGRDNTQVKASLRLLAAENKLAELRLLVIPEHSDYLAHVDALAAFIRELGNVPVRLNAFHTHGVFGAAKTWRSATAQDIAPLAEALLARGITTVQRPTLYL